MNILRRLWSYLESLVWRFRYRDRSKKDDTWLSAFDEEDFIDFDDLGDYF
jgi:hypothetical protein